MQVLGRDSWAVQGRKSVLALSAAIHERRSQVLSVLSSETASVVSITVGGVVGGLVLWAFLIEGVLYLLS
jgi:hypothetical protein